MIKSCYIRVDANNNIGIGHLVRTEILADELAKRNYNIIFLCIDIPKKYSDKLELKNYNVIILNGSESEQDNLLSIIEKNDESLLIIDSDIEEFYSKKFQVSIRDNGIKLMIITFFHNYHFYADIILNQNIMALSQSYSSEDYTIKLLGPKNVILNSNYKIISKNLDNYKTNLKNKTILITFGGVDQPDRTSFVYKSLTQLEYRPDKVIVVLGALYGNRKILEKVVNKSKIATEIYQNTPKMPYLLAEADIVFNSGGLTVWESGILKALNVIIGFSKREQIGGKFIDDNNLGIYLGTKEGYTNKSLTAVIDKIIMNDNSEVINNLYSKIDVNGIKNTINAIKKIDI